MMVRPRKVLDEFRAEIEPRIASGQNHKEIRSWLATQGVQISKNTFSTRCIAWEPRPRSKSAGSTPVLVSAVEGAFHTTRHDDETITGNINAQGIPTPQSQVKKVRLAHGWRRRGNNDGRRGQPRAHLRHFSRLASTPSY